ncbi:mechanosensitive ion channel domain-containing protein [Gaetbulibacter aestuarii]|uniref:Mechanosensitive ion channel domain-containing protein n=1 Tax=Gaetbulibacter aestuarii TaxID=1502358 RepID=A0ABW7MZ39_9FLAO
MLEFFNNNQQQLIVSGFVLLALLIIRYVLHFTIRKIGKKSHINDARIRLINRYISVALFLIAILIESYVFGSEFQNLAVVFSTVFGVIGIGLFAIWSILSNITSGIIMFFNFPYKVGDKIKINDSDFPDAAIIEDIRAFQVHLRLENGDLVTYPNNLLIQKSVTLIQKDAIEDFEVEDEI